MAAPTEPGALAACPVCQEPLEGRPARCFRCETPLDPWWGFEDALRAVKPAGRTAARRRPGTVPGWLAGAVIGGEILFCAGIVVGVLREPAPMAAPPAASTTAAAPRTVARVVAPARPRRDIPQREPPPAILRYRVQRGDSLWRIAGALTGQGHRWRELWPQHARGDGRVSAGTVLDVDVGRLSQPSR